MKTFTEAVKELNVDLVHFQNIWMDFVKHDRDLSYLQQIMHLFTDNEKELVMYIMLNDMTDKALEALQDIGQYLNEVKCND